MVCFHSSQRRLGRFGTDADEGHCKQMPLDELRSHKCFDCQFQRGEPVLNPKRLGLEFELMIGVRE